jgi:transposase
MQKDKHKANSSRTNIQLQDSKAKETTQSYLNKQQKPFEKPKENPVNKNTGM